MKMRTEHDSMGEVMVPESAYYGAQTQRAVNNFKISAQQLPEAFIRAVVLIKKTAASSNGELGVISTDVAAAIVAACDELMQENDLLEHFPVSLYQTGSGTSTNMNANEVIAYLAAKASEKHIHPNDHVNAGQSSNDVIPSAIHISAALSLAGELLPALGHCIEVTEHKARSLVDVIKTGRTHLMDAMPVSMEQLVDAWAAQLRSCRDHLSALQPCIQRLAQGGTAVGTGINTHPSFASIFCRLLSDQTGLRFSPTDNFFSLIGSQDTAVALSGQLKTLAVAFIKIANDLRWMNSGPLAGLGEIRLQALQPGSSIMPGKVNPVIPEAVIMACYQVIGHDAAITLGGQSGNFELNVTLPLIASNLLNSLDLLTGSSRSLADQVIASFTVNDEQLQIALQSNPILVTALNTKIGYERAAAIAKQAYEQRRPIVDVAAEQTNLTHEDLSELLDPRQLIHPK